MADEKHGKTLFIRNLPYSTTNDQLEEVFSNIGPLKSCFVVSDKESGKCRGFGYVKFTILEDAKSALETVKKINGRQVHIQYANKKEKKKRFGVPKTPPAENGDIENKSPEEPSQKSTNNEKPTVSNKLEQEQASRKRKRKEDIVVPVKGQKQAPNPRNEGKRARLIVRNLSFKCTKDELKQAFSKFGTIEDIHIPEKGHGKRLGFGFVQFSTKAQAGMAITELNGKEIKGRVVAVDWALPKDKFETKIAATKADDSMEVEAGNESVEEENKEASDRHEVSMEKDDDENEEDSEEADEEDDASENEEDDSSENEDDEESEESGDDDVESDDSEEDENVDGNKKMPVRESDVNQGRTVFVRNLPFNVGDEDVEEFFSQFGEVNYARTVIDHKTGIPKGSAFVQFASKDSAESCLNATGNSDGGESNLNLGGRQLIVTLAVSREQAGELAQKKDKKKEQKDTRNLYLAREGMIRPGTEAAKGVSPADLAKRVKIDSAKRLKLRDQNVFVSSVRLCLHNLPATVGDKELRKIVLKAAQDKSAKLTECRIMRDLNRVNSEGVGKSRGYAFCAFTQHEHALAALRHLNNNPSIFGEKKRPIVEFSLENRKALEAKQKRLEKSKAKLLQKPSKSNKVHNNKNNNQVTKESTQSHGSTTSGAAKRKKRKLLRNAKDSKPLETRKAQDQVARSLHKGPLGLPSHSGPKQRHKPRPNQQPVKKFDKKNRQGQFKGQNIKTRKEKPVKFQSSKKKRKDTDSFDRLVASYKNKIMKSASI